jgi:hypothetical protein
MFAHSRRTGGRCRSFWWAQSIAGRASLQFSQSDWQCVGFDKYSQRWGRVTKSCFRTGACGPAVWLLNDRIEEAVEMLPYLQVRAQSDGHIVVATADSALSPLSLI